MKKSRLPQIAELTLVAPEGATVKTTCKFTGTDVPRSLRCIHSLLIRPRRREEIDLIAGVTHEPELITELRRRRLCAPCQQTPGIDRTGCSVRFCVYEFNDDRPATNAWLCKHEAGSKA